jgi:hypothetical protein
MGDSRLQQSLGGQLPHRCHARAPEASPSHRRESPVSGGFRVSTASDGRGSSERKRSRSRPLTCRRESPERRRLAWLGPTAGRGSTRRATSRREAGIMTLVRCAPRRDARTRRSGAGMEEVGAASAGETMIGERRREICRSSTLFSCGVRPGEAGPGSARASGPGAGACASLSAELKRGEIQDDQRSQ